MDIEKGLYDEIKEYCRMNGLKVTKYVNTLIRRAFNEDRYGDAPFISREETSFPVIKESPAINEQEHKRNPEDIYDYTRPAENKDVIKRIKKF